MDTLIYGGDHYLDARGIPVVVEGGRELIQRALIRLQVKKGSFPQDPGLGSDLYKLRRNTGDTNTRVAMSYVQEALAPITEIAVTTVTLEAVGMDQLKVAVGIQLEGVFYQLEVVNRS